MKNGQKLNILIVHNFYQIPGGEDTVVTNEKLMLEEQGNQVILYSRNNSELKDYSKFQKLMLPFTTVFNVHTYFEIKKIIRKNNIDIIHVHNTLNLISPSVYYAALSSGVPVVQTVHNFRLLCPAATFYRDNHICEDCLTKGLKCSLKYKCYRNSRLQTLACVITTKIHRFFKVYGKINYICLTDFNKKKILSLKQIKPSQIFVKPNFSEKAEFPLISKAERKAYIFAGRLDELKGIDFLLYAWEKLGENAPKLIICGTGPKESWCKEYIQEKRLNIDMKGFLSNNEVKELVAKSKALILPTRWYEGFPMSIVESLSVGTPVLCSDIGNSGSIIQEGITGAKFNPTDLESFQQAYLRLNKYENIYATSLQYYIDHFTRNENYEMLMAIYRSILKK